MQPLWTPSPERIAASNLARFAADASALTGHDLSDYDDLWSWSIDDPAAFWGLTARFCGLRFRTPPDAVCLGAGMRGTAWFPGATLNVAENLLNHDEDALAVLARDEAGHRRDVTFGELRRDVAAFQTFLAANGVGVGDRIAAWMPNRYETVVAMLAAAGLGAIFSSSSPDFGIKGVLDRFGQIGPKVLVASDGAILRRQAARQPAKARGDRPRPGGGPRGGGRRARGGRGRSRRHPQGDGMGGRTRSRRRHAPVRAAAIRPPAVHHVQLWAPRACRSASCMVRAARCCSTQRNTSCTPTYVLATASSTTPPAGG